LILDLHGKFVDLEWQQRNRLLLGTQHTAPSSPSPWSRLTGPTIAPRNRYLNVEPYAANRIHLQVADGENDYINASPIVLGKRRYIATQGPKDTGVGHFWRMVQEQNVGVVVMLTQTHEAGREKCWAYYPVGDGDEERVVRAEDEGWKGEVELEALREDARARSQVRQLRLRTSQEESGEKTVEKDVHHLLFAGWPDFLVPEGEDRAALVELVRLSAALSSSSSSSTTSDTALPQALENVDPARPRIIHCSAGVGRSGTFIALDYLLHQLHTGGLDNLPNDKDPIVEVVDELRQQRMMMVQGEGQFMFLYDVLRELWIARAIEIGQVNGDRGLSALEERACA
jgi:protein-tyrosine phosphatase